MSNRNEDTALLLAVLLAFLAGFLAPEPSAGLNPVPMAAFVLLIAVGVWRWHDVLRPVDAAGVWEGEVGVPDGVLGATSPAPLTLDLHVDGGRRILHPARLSGTVGIGSVTLPVSSESMVAGWLVCDEIVVIAEDREDGELRAVAMRGSFSGGRMTGRIWSWTADGWATFEANRTEERGDG